MQPTDPCLNPYFVEEVQIQFPETTVKDRSYTGDYTFKESSFQNCNFKGNIKFTNPNAVFKNCTFHGFTTFSGGKAIGCSIRGFTKGPISNEDNLPSKKIIENAGGVFEGLTDQGENLPKKRLYWLKTRPTKK